MNKREVSYKNTRIKNIQKKELMCEVDGYTRLKEIKPYNV